MESLKFSFIGLAVEFDKVGFFWQASAGHKEKN